MRPNIVCTYYFVYVWLYRTIIAQIYIVSALVYSNVDVAISASIFSSLPWITF